MKIKIVRNSAGIGYAYCEGEQINVTEAFGNELIELGYAITIHNKPTSLPEEIPGRKILIDSGFESIDEIKRLTKEELTEIKGIGNKLAESIINFIK